MTEEEASFRRAICESPEDDAPRLVFADWLDEHDQPERAAFIRRQCELAGLDPFDRRFLEVSLLQPGTLTGSKFRQALPKLPRGLRWPADTMQRGFAATLAAVDSMNRFLQHGPTLLETEPVRELTLPDRLSGRTIDALAASPLLARLSSLRTVDLGLDRPLANLQPLLDSPYAGSLRKLDWNRVWFGDGQVEALLRSPLFRQLEDFRIVPSWFGGGQTPIRFADTLAQAGPAPKLRSLVLRQVQLNEAEVKTLFGPDLLPNLRDLDLSWNENLGTAGLARLLTRSTAPICSLTLFATGLDRTGVSRLADWPGLVGLRQLSLGYNDLGVDGVGVLANCEGLRGLSVLELDRNRLGDECVPYLIESPNLSGLNVLNLALCEITFRGARLLANAASLDSLLRLDLRFNNLTNDARSRLKKRFGQRVLLD